MLVVCPQECDSVVKTLRDIIRCSATGSGGSLLAVYHEPSTLPTVDTIRKKLGPQIGISSLDAVLVFGYENAQLGVTELKIKRWIDGLADLVRSEYRPMEGQRYLSQIERFRGLLFVQMARLPRELWQHAARRYHGLVHKMGLRLDSVNSLRGSNLFDIRMTAMRHKNLAQSLARILDGHHERFIGYLRKHGQTLKPTFLGRGRKLIEDGDAMVGIFIPDESAASAETWWDLVEPVPIRN
ncbi:uncharacterized protein yc1106_02749 [Curvularia clavata]|uniref:Uncharacterized protein n=1 Tax=Curvularia clavata TaxID=95742 RepID=A0A9Q9DQW2_CURCL|nr:uncharacterized protein yc1106_02749 [Curvularia clavata]